MQQLPRPYYALDELIYDLPAELIAQHPATTRSASRLLHVRVADGECSDLRFENLPDLLPPDSLVVLNDSKVIPARLFGHRATGGQVEVLYLRHVSDSTCEVMLGSNAKLGPGEEIFLPGEWKLRIAVGKSLDGSSAVFVTNANTAATRAELLRYLQQHGEVPLPPYIHRQRGETEASSEYLDYDRERYQTVFASVAGSVAAPTAGLHFDSMMLDRLRFGGHTLGFVTLHVGIGTFAPVRVEDLAQHEMYEELFSISEVLALEYLERRERARPICAVGTTSLRALHALTEQVDASIAKGPDVAAAPALFGEWCPTRAFIYPGHGTTAADLLLTNFHLPRSSLLALVYSFGGPDLMKRVYQHAIDASYRFFSYGDCMLIDRRGAHLSPDGTVIE